MRVTGGRFAQTLPVPVDVIETRDARDGRPHCRVVVYFHDDERVIVIPSKAGMPEDPFWYQNALADPNVRFGGHPFRAEVVDDPASQARTGASPIVSTRPTSPTARSPHATTGRSRSSSSLRGDLPRIGVASGHGKEWVAGETFGKGVALEDRREPAERQCGGRQDGGLP